MTPLCMGGWCHLRDKCLYYRPGVLTSQPYERLCEPGNNDAFINRIVLFKPVQIKEAA